MTTSTRLIERERRRTRTCNMKNLVYRMLDRLFKYEPIPKHEPTCLHRWILWRGQNGRGVYLHEFIANEPRDPHDHPKHFISIGLKGRYQEIQHAADYPDRWKTVEYRAPWIRRFRPDHVHRIELRPGETCWTLAIVGPTKRDWGFHTRDKSARVWIGHKEYNDRRLNGANGKQKSANGEEAETRQSTPKPTAASPAPGTPSPAARGRSKS